MLRKKLNAMLWCLDSQLTSLVGISKDLHGPRGLWGSQWEASCWILHVFEKHWNRWATSTVLWVLSKVDIAHLFEHFLFSYFVFFSFIFILHEQGNFKYHNGTWGSRNSASLTPILPRCVFVKPWCLGRTPSKIIFINLAEATWVPFPSYHLPSQQLENAHGLARGSAVQCPYLLWPSGHSAVGQPGSVHLPDRLLDRGQNALQCTKEKEIQLHVPSNIGENSLSCLFGPRKNLAVRYRNGLKVHRHPWTYAFVPTFRRAYRSTKQSIYQEEHRLNLTRI